MFTITKYELNYHWIRIGVILMLPLLYTVLTFAHSNFNFEEEVYARIIFPILFGMIPVVLIAVSWTISMKEFRMRKLMLLPVTRKRILSGRLITAILPLCLLVIYGFGILTKLDYNWSPITQRIIYQYGTTSLLITTLYFVFELLNATDIKSDLAKVSIGVLVFAISFLFIFIVDGKLWHKVYQSDIGLLYVFSAFLIMLLGSFTFTKRKNYLV